jgi:hypothetical protein
MPRTVLGNAVLALLALIAAGGAGVGLAPSASAHDVLLGTSPQAGTTITALPSAVVLTFDRPALALGTQLRIQGPGGDVAQGTPQLVDQTVRQGIRPGSQPGTYTVQWKVTSADGHPISGQFTFALAQGTSASPATGPSTSAATALPAGTAGPASASGSDGGGSALPWLLVTAGVIALGGVAAAISRRTRRVG